MRSCSKCNKNKPDTDYQFRKGRPSGQCRACKTLSEKNRRATIGIKPRDLSKIVDNNKLCMECKIFKDFGGFTPCKRGLGGLATYCRSCISTKYNDPEKAKKATQKYRDKNRLRWRTSHRINQRDRKRIIKTVSDKTVTDSFLESLYSTSVCYYCNLITSFEKRTADHRISLNKGGLHSSSNLVMACVKCNSSKRDMTELKFREKLNANKG